MFCVRTACCECVVYLCMQCLLHCFVRYDCIFVCCFPSSFSHSLSPPSPQELLNDPSVVVRVTGVVGVCRVLSYFWEMVPAAVIKSLLTRLIRDLAWDASAIGVRVAVLQVGWTLYLQCTVSYHTANRAYSNLTIKAATSSHLYIQLKC